MTLKIDTVVMDNSANEDPEVWYRVRHARTIIVTVTVCFLIIPQFLNGISFNAVTHDIRDVWHISDDMPFFKSWDEVRKRTQISYIVVGMLAYGLFAFLFEKCRRKTCLYLVCICQLTTSILLLCTNSYWLLHASRASSAISDVGAGMFCVIYVSEIAPDDIRGSLVAIHKLLYGFIEFIPVIIYLSDVPIKPLPFYCVSIIVSILVGICTYVGVPESPIYCLRREDMSGAEESLKFLYKNERNVSQLLSDKKNILKATRSDFQTTTSIFQECIKRRTLKFSCVAIVLYSLRVIAGISFEGYTMETVLWGFPDIKLAVSRYFLIIECISVFICSILVTVLCDRVGRKKLLVLSAFVSSVSLVASAIVLYVERNYLHNTWDIFEEVFIAFCVVNNICFNLGLRILPEVLISDIFPPKILNTQIAILGSLDLCVYYVVHYEIKGPWKSPLRQDWLLFMFGGLSFFGTSFIMKFVSETKRLPSGFLFFESEHIVSYNALEDEIE